MLNCQTHNVFVNIPPKSGKIGMQPQSGGTEPRKCISYVWRSKATYVPGEHIKKNEGKGLFELKWRNFASQNAREINWVFHEVSSSALLARLWLHTSRLPTTVVVTGAFWIASSFFFHGLKVFFFLKYINNLFLRKLNSEIGKVVFKLQKI